MTAAQIETYAEEVRALIEERLRVQASTLDKALSKAGRLLPKWAHREGKFLCQAMQHLAHPKLRIRVDEARVEQAHETLVAHLQSIDPSERRKTRILSMLGAISLNLILVAAAFITYLVWRGFV